MEIKKLKRMPYAQAHIEKDESGNIYLFSYYTLVCILTSDGWLTCTGTYSPTTRKHIGAFMKEYVTYPNGENGTYQDAKYCYENKKQFNILTGEVEDL